MADITGAGVCTYNLDREKHIRIVRMISLMFPYIVFWGHCSSNTFVLFSGSQAEVRVYASE